MRCFLGLEIPQHIRSELVLQQFLMPVQRRVPPENFHLTLVFLGDAGDAALTALDEALTRLDSAPPQIEIRGLGLFGGAKAHNLHATVAPDPALMALQERLVRRARDAGLAPEKRRYSPHVTLAYLRPGSFEQPALEQAVAGAASFRTEPFTATEVVLFRAHLRADGAQYDVLERYPLSPALRAVDW